MIMCSQVAIFSFQDIGWMFLKLQTLEDETVKNIQLLLEFLKYFFVSYNINLVICNNHNIHFLNK